MSVNRHLVGLLLGAEEDWPQAFEAISTRLGVFRYEDVDHVIDTERVHIHPFNLRDRARHQVVIDRLAYWYYHPREWLKKVALMDDAYLLNSPFTFQSMEKHSAYCALIRLGMNVPDTVLVPYKNPIDNVRWAYTSRNYNDPFDLATVAAAMGYPLFMKPFDGGGWRGVSKVRNQAELMAAYLEGEHGLTDVLVERESRNCGENVVLAREVVRGAGLVPDTVALVQDPTMQRRMDAVFRLVWPEATAVNRPGRRQGRYAWPHDRWVELVLVPERAVHWVLGPSPKEEAGGG